jgi:hypothetical protein
VKTRLQVNPGFSMSAMIKSEGAMSLYKGIAAAWLREASYTSIKLGAYGPIKDLLCGDRKDVPFVLKFSAGSASGAIGTMFGNPFDVLKTMQMAGESKGVPALMGQLYKNQGMAGFYRGIEANVMRAIVLNGTKMACYDESKSFVVQQTGWNRKDLRTQFSAACVAGFFMSVTVAPFDNVRTRLMNQPTDAKLYNGFVDCCAKTLKNDGPMAFYRGFFAIWGRFAPQATLQLVVFEKMLQFTGYDAL